MVQWSDLGYLGFLRRYVGCISPEPAAWLSAQGRVPAHPVRDRGRLGGAPAGGSVDLSFPLDRLSFEEAHARSLARPAAARVARPPRSAPRPSTAAGLAPRPRQRGRGRARSQAASSLRCGCCARLRLPSRSSRRRLRRPSRRSRRRPPAKARSMVQAAGAVLSPGVYRVPADARVIDVIDAAGGLAPGADADRLALAAKVSDGERVYVPGSARRCRALPRVRPSRQGPSTSTPRQSATRRAPGCRTRDREGNRDLPREPRAVHFGRSAARGARHRAREARSAR